MGVRVTLPDAGALIETHPCRFKPLYYAMFVDPIADALRAAGAEVTRSSGSERGIFARFGFPDGLSCRAIVDYADQVHIDGLVDMAMADVPRERWRLDANGFDVLFKMKPCDRFAAEYDAFTRETGIAVVPWGYLLAPTNNGDDPDTCRADRKWFLDSLTDLRAAQGDVLRGRAPTVRSLMTRGSFHALYHCEQRRNFFEDALFQGEKMDVPFRPHIEELARCGAMLNLCGPDNTIDRKVVEACAIGVPIVSNDGLADLRLPRGRRFIHGENVWFVRSPAELRAIAKDGLPLDVRERLAVGGLALWANCFEPAVVGEWMVEQARLSASGRL